MLETILHAHSQAEARTPEFQHHDMGPANNKGADQPVLPRSLISGFVIRYLKSKVTIIMCGPRRGIGPSDPPPPLGKSCYMGFYRNKH